jgi:uncharacterized protein (TIGR00369 family)
MTEKIEGWQQRLDEVAQLEHPDCYGCGVGRPGGLGLRFIARESGEVEAAFSCRETYQGYPGLLHGGITSALLDAAMANCIFAHGRAGVTARLIVRFLLPIATDRAAVVRARMRELSPPLFVLEAEVVQDGRTVATGAGKFIERTAC